MGFLMAFLEKWRTYPHDPNKDHQWCTKKSLILHAQKFTTADLTEVGSGILAFVLFAAHTGVFLTLTVCRRVVRCFPQTGIPSR
jgi:hypothetical protein